MKKGLRKTQTLRVRSVQPPRPVEAIGRNPVRKVGETLALGPPTSRGRYVVSRYPRISRGSYIGSANDCFLSHREAAPTDEIIIALFGAGMKSIPFFLRDAS